MNRVLIQVLAITLSTIYRADVLAADATPSPDRPYWQSIPWQGQGYLSLAFHRIAATDEDDDLDGLSLSWGGWGEDPYRFGLSKPFPSALGPYFWLSGSRNRDQALWTTGFGADLAFLMLGPVRVFPRFSIGLTYRTENPDQGWGGVVGVGLGTGVWLGDHVQAVVATDRDFDFTAPDSFRYTLEIRLLSGRLPFPVAE